MRLLVTERSVESVPNRKVSRLLLGAADSAMGYCLTRWLRSATDCRVPKRVHIVSRRPHAETLAHPLGGSPGIHVEYSFQVTTAASEVIEGVNLQPIGSLPNWENT